MKTLIHSVSIVLTDSCEIMDGYIIVENGLFTAVKEGSPSAKEVQSADRLTDGKGKWLMPGLVNTHGHLGSALLRGAGDDMPLMTWLQTVMWPNEAKFDGKTVVTAAQLAMLEMVKSGTTAFLDMYHLNMDKVAETVLDHNLKAVLGRGMIGLCSEEEQKEKLAESVNLFKQFDGAGEGRLKIAMTPHAPYTCPPPFMAKAAEAAGKHGMLIHTHVSETRAEVAKHVEEYGKRPVKHLEELGFFENSALVAHAVHVDEDEINILARHNAAVSHNPVSNLKLGSGIAPVPDLLKKGITVSVGTDSTASNNKLDMFEEMRTAALIHKGISEDAAATNAWDILACGTLKGAEALKMADTGLIKEGYKADFIMLDPDEPHLTPALADRIPSHLVYAARGSDVTDVYIDGRPVLENREFCTFDEERIIAEANELAKKMIRAKQK